jgi:hypothetical protein
MFIGVARSPSSVVTRQISVVRTVVIIINRNCFNYRRRHRYYYYYNSGYRVLSFAVSDRCDRANLSAVRFPYSTKVQFVRINRYPASIRPRRYNTSDPSETVIALYMHVRVKCPTDVPAARTRLRRRRR